MVQGHLGRQEGPRPRGPRVPQDPMEELSLHRRTQDPQEPQSSNDIMKSLNGKSVIIHVSGEVQTLVQYILKGPDPGSVIYSLKHQ